MIITILLNIPDELLENTIAKDYEQKITACLTDEVRKCLIEHDKSYSYNRNKTAKDGLDSWISGKIDKVIADYKDDIIAAASDKLAERLARTKAAKELIKNDEL